ncbi:TetR/AcrR family transcriptional regulator [Aquimarina aquimarini]|uniref:TetR/AcrR family transcriptional regulator n=1 Tax=Aquimarina aquimarini TaxID=1191734 RepID=UPI001F2BCD53|nr:TetR/AcrR family transcriptional regulator [Aquimarina aquimarini]
MAVREKLIQTASTLFHKQGYNSTGINQIIEEAGIAKGSFYYNFKSKEDLCIAYLNDRHDYWFNALKQYIRTHKKNGVPLLLAFDFLVAINKKENFRGCSFINILSEINENTLSILEVVQNHKNDLRNYLSDISETPMIADHVYLLFESAILESKLFRDQWPVLKAREIVESLLK